MGKVFNGCKLSLREKCEMSGNQRQSDWAELSERRVRAVMTVWRKRMARRGVGGNIKY